MTHLCLRKVRRPLPSRRRGSATLMKKTSKSYGPTLLLCYIPSVPLSSLALHFALLDIRDTICISINSNATSNMHHVFSRWDS
ncbi:hypothetical protein DL93DRAFT_553540 [Clavulina sp. PMI_390]|nr:hypothetical protein DL93DRAFT_553540 [Clavulina sp. PMI_390]